MRNINNYNWSSIMVDNNDNIILEHINDENGNKISENKFKLTINDLSDNSGNTLYRFYVSNDISGNDECKKEIRSLLDEPQSFIFDQSLE